MKQKLLATLVMAFVVGAAATGAVAADGPGGKDRGATATRAGAPAYLTGNGPMTSQERGDYARDFVKKWGPYFQTTYQQPVNTWAQKQAKVIGTADAQNLRAAMGKTTMEAAMMTMRGHQVSDDQAIDFLARQPERRPGELPATLGDLAKDLVYTPVTPCRIFDTRNMTAGPINAGTTRPFDTQLYGTWTGYERQGGAPNTDCGMIAGAAAVAINIAAPLPESGGFLTVHPYGSARPLASNLDYKAGELKNNEIVARTGAGSWDINVYAHGKTHVVGDVVGYYAAPAATALECTTASETITIAANWGGTVHVTCPAGYSAAGAGGMFIHSGGYGFVETSPIAGASGWHIYGGNQTAYPQAFEGSVTCCRVPGR